MNRGLGTSRQDITQGGEGGLSRESEIRWQCCPSGGKHREGEGAFKVHRGARQELYLEMD